MNTNKKSNRIVLCLCSILVMFASIFAFVPLHKETKVVKADSVDISYDFVGSNFTLPTYVMGLRQGTSGIYKHYGTSFINVSFSFNVSSSNSSVLTKQSTHVLNSDIDSIGDFGGNSFLVPKDNTYKYFSLFISELYYMEDGTSVVDDIYCDALALCNSSAFNSNIRSIVFGSYLNNPLLDIPFTWFKYYNYVKYIDNNGNYILFAIVITNDDGSVDEIDEPELFALDYRTYYLSNDLTDSDIYREGFEQGKSQGYIEGEKIGLDKGYQDGFEAGEDSGYWDGYEQALENDGRYNFTNLIASVIDVPVKTFASLFNFEILGVNLSGFFLGLLTCCIVIGVIKLIL